MEESTEEPVRMRDSSSKELPSLPGCKGDEAEAEVEEDAVDTGCGWRCFRPRILAPFAHVWTFIVLYIVFAFTHAVQGSYPIAVLTTLERRFNLPSSLAGFLVNTSVFGYFISIVVCSLFLAKANNPRLFACCMLLTSVGAFLYYLPHIVCRAAGNDAIDTAHAQMQTSFDNVTRPEMRSGVIQLCSGGGSNSGSTADGSSEAPERGMCRDREGQTPAVDDDGGVSYVVSAVAILCIADLVHGIAGAPGWVVGLAYIDDHTDPELSAKLIGLMYTVRLISPIVSFAMGGYLLSIHSTLKDTELTPKHPQWIGAWWMGFLINSIINFIIAIPMSMLPEKLRPIRKSTSTEVSPEKGNATPEKVEWKHDGKDEERGKDEGRGKEEENETREENGKEEENGKGEGHVKKKEHAKDEENGKGEKREVDRNRNKAKEAEEHVGNEGKYRKREDRKDGEEEKKEARLGKKELVEDMKTYVIQSTIEEQQSSIGRTKPIDVSSIDWKEFPKAMIRLITNPIYVLTVLAICSDWAALEFMSFMPKYFEVHFQKTASVANLLGGMIPAMFAAVASYVGGVIAGKIKGMDGGVAGLCRMNFSLTLISVLLFVPALLLSCPNIKYSGHLVNDRLNVTTSCNVNCGCSSDVFDPVCGSDRLLYFSPCHAGCTQLVNLSTALLHNDLEGQLVRSKECHCVGDVEGRDEDDDYDRGKIVFAGFCDESCASLIPFVFILIAIVVVSCLYNSSSTTIILRCIKKEDKSFALGFEALCICFSQVPAPLLYGMIYDTSCVMKTVTPCTDSKGSCQLYDRHALRLHFHGLAMGLKSMAIILYGAAFVQARRKLSLLTAQEKMRPIALTALNEDTM